MKTLIALITFACLPAAAAEPNWQPDRELEGLASSFAEARAVAEMGSRLQGTEPTVELARKALAARGLALESTHMFKVLEILFEEGKRPSMAEAAGWLAGACYFHGAKNAPVACSYSSIEVGDHGPLQGVPIKIVVDVHGKSTNRDRWVREGNTGAWREHVRLKADAFTYPVMSDGGILFEKTYSGGSKSKYNIRKFGDYIVVKQEEPSGTWYEYFYQDIFPSRDVPGARLDNVGFRLVRSRR